MNDRVVVAAVLPPLAASVAIHIAAFLIIDCIKPDCGDGVVQLSEECDDGNELPKDGCSPRCELEPVCGNGKIEGEPGTEDAEECDDGNRLDHDGCSSACKLELEIRPLDDPPPEEEEPEPEPEPEPEEPEPPPPEQEVEPPPPPPKKKEKKQEKPKEQPPDAPPPPVAIELPSDQVITGGGSGVNVIAGEETKAGSAGGKKEGKKGGKKDGKGETVGGKGEEPSPVKSGPKWTPGSGLYVKSFPVKAKDVKLPCPAVIEQGISGKVKLKVQVWRTGKVRRVKVIKGMGHGCDEVAVKAIKKMKWKPAINNSGKPMDYEVVYTYEFRPPR